MSLVCDSCGPLPDSVPVSRCKKCTRMFCCGAQAPNGHWSGYTDVCMSCVPGGIWHSLCEALEVCEREAGFALMALGGCGIAVGEMHVRRSHAWCAMKWDAVREGKNETP